MMTHRICSGGRRNAAAMDGNAMFTMASGDTTNPPAAAIQRVMACMMARLSGVVEFAGVKILSALIFPLFLLAGCATESPEEKAATRLRQAEAAMEECKRQGGLAGGPTPRIPRSLTCLSSAANP